MAKGLCTLAGVLCGKAVERAGSATGRITKDFMKRKNSTAKRTPGSLHPVCSTEYAVEWRRVDGRWERLTGTRDNVAQATEYARWFFKDWLEHPKVRCIEIIKSERVL